jgi:hypothetical protein
VNEIFGEVCGIRVDIFREGDFGGGVWLTFLEKVI